VLVPSVALYEGGKAYRVLIAPLEVNEVNDVILQRWYCPAGPSSSELIPAAAPNAAVHSARGIGERRKQ
jgi:hypothetical protein